MSEQKPAAGDLLPPELSLNDVLAVVTVALSRLPGADGMLICRAQATLEAKFTEGVRRGVEVGVKRGYELGYGEGVDDGRREALDRTSAELAERASIRASVQARRSP